MLNLRELFKEEINNLPDYIVLVVADIGRYQEVNIEILKLLVAEQKTPGVYVTLNKPYRIMQRLMKQNNIDERMVIFIDAVTNVGNDSIKIPNCLFIGSPEKLSDISMAIDQAVKALQTESKFIFFDSLNTLAIFNNPPTVARFVHFLTVKMRELKVKGVITTLPKDIDEKILDELTQLCDVRIDAGKNKKQLIGGG